MTEYAAVVLAGGAGRRLGGAAKPLLPVGDRPMLDRVLTAVADAAAVVVVGPADLPVPAEVLRVCEEPPGGGPVAALAAGLAALPGGPETVAVLAADLPFLTAGAVAGLRAALDASSADGVVFVDTQGRRQTLCGVWRGQALRQRLTAAGPHPGMALRTLLTGLTVGEITGSDQPPPWYDCDEPDDLERARRWS